MRILFCYSSPPKLVVLNALEKYAPEAEFIDTSGSIFDYNLALASRWAKDDLVVIEGDKEITSDVIPAFSCCDEPWCIFEYWNYPVPYQKNTIYGLGCTKYSLATQQQIDASEFFCPDPTWLARCPVCDGAGCWNYLDTRITLSILSKCISFAPHIHGRVNHHHTYPPDWAKQRGLESLCQHWMRPSVGTPST